MTPIEQLYYALGEVAYAIAKADGTIQKEEKEKLQSILETEFRVHKPGFEITEIIFQILQKDETDSKTAYDWALKAMRLNSQYISENLKQHFINVIKKVAAAFPPTTSAEREYIDDFIYQLKSIKGDSVFSYETE
ncbi:MAG TPA: hypothetical protein VFJ43_01815 [Bacteroidia bacterium]|nr:hypothetical protein [Bacteroidia bacterium]